MAFQFSPGDVTHSARSVTSKCTPVHAPGYYRNYGKRAFDILSTLIVAPFILPVIGLMALLIALDGRNPFYSQIRIGKNGERFRMWKLRTMVHNADQLLAACLAESSEARLEWDKTQKLKDDPRITWLGRVLRKTSMDELPQLLNVLNGSMSLVGPRPMMVQQRESYHGTAYFRLRPGITGLWQVSDRNNSTFSARVSFDELYNQSISFKNDTLILLQTVSAVLRCTGY